MTFPKSFQVGGNLPIPLVISNKTAAYTVQATDAGTIINCTSGTFTVSLTAAATLASGFNVTIWNTSATFTDAITIDPAGAETIDGLSTLIIRRGEGMQIVCNGTNWSAGAKKVMLGYAENFNTGQLRPTASGNFSVALGRNATASGTGSFAFNYGSVASNDYAVALGPNTLASGAYSVALGNNSAGFSAGSQAVTGSGAMALGGSYASGTDSFAAAIANNTSTYGARGVGSLALGTRANSSGAGTFAVGDDSSATATWAVAVGASAQATGAYSVAFGANANVYGPTASGASSFAFGTSAKAVQIGKFAFGGSDVIGGTTAASIQAGKIVLRRATTDATATVLTSNGVAPTTTNQCILANNQAMTITGSVICRQSVAQSDKASGWTFTAVIRRGATAASTALVAAVVPVLVAQDISLAATVLAVTADTTNGGLAVTATGIAATNLYWVCNVDSVEITYA